MTPVPTTTDRPIISLPRCIKSWTAVEAHIVDAASLRAALSVSDARASVRRRMRPRETVGAAHSPLNLEPTAILSHSMRCFSTTHQPHMNQVTAESPAGRDCWIISCPSPGFGRRVAISSGQHGAYNAFRAWRGHAPLNVNMMAFYARKRPFLVRLRVQESSSR